MGVEADLRVMPDLGAYRLRDGRHVEIRTLDASDAPALERAIARADPFDLRRRFMGPPPPTHVLVKLLATADGIRDAAIGAFALDGRLIAVAQFDRRDSEPDAEVAIEVGRDWQRVGLGSELLRRIARLAASAA